MFRSKLNDVERGGRTAFPRIGAALSPVKGAAAFWYNLKRSGKPDPMTLHGACPVLLGFKWGNDSDKDIFDLNAFFFIDSLIDYFQ